MTTATTVGSTLEPITVEGRAIALGIMLLGISLIAAMAGIFADGLLRTDADVDRRLIAIEAQLTRIERRLVLVYIRRSLPGVDVVGDGYGWSAPPPGGSNVHQVVWIGRTPGRHG